MGARGSVGDLRPSCVALLLVASLPHCLVASFPHFLVASLPKNGRGGLCNRPFSSSLAITLLRRALRALRVLLLPTWS
jgi:hypothetical protein